MSLAPLLDRTALAHPDFPAVAIGPKTIQSYRELAGAAARIAAWLKKTGARRSTPVAIVSENRSEVLESVFGCWWAGFSVAPLDPDADADDLRRALAHAEAQIVIVSPRHASAAAAAAGPAVKHILEMSGREFRRALRLDPIAPRSVAPNAAAWLAFEEIEPGERPCAAMLSHDALTHLSLSLLAEVDMTLPRDSQILAGRWHGSGGFTILPVIARGGVVVMPESGDFDPAEVFENAAAWRRASTLASPTQLRRMARSTADVAETNFRTMVLHGEPAAPGLVAEALERFGSRIAQVYGQNAFPLGLTRLNRYDVAARGDPNWRNRAGAGGRPFMCTEISLRAPSGPVTQDWGAIGQICARSVMGMKGFWREPILNAESQGGGWRRTADVGVFDANGYLRVLGRLEDLLTRRRGEPAQVAPCGPEEALMSDPGVIDAAVVEVEGRLARRDGPNGPIRVGFVQNCPHADVRQSSLLGVADDRLNVDVDVVVPLDTVPRTASGRAHRRTLRRLAKTALGAMARSAPASAAEQGADDAHDQGADLRAGSGSEADKARYRARNARQV